MVVAFAARVGASRFGTCRSPEACRKRQPRFAPTAPGRPGEVERHQVGSHIGGLSSGDRPHAHLDGGEDAAPRAFPEETP
jgi:hypothetical protein